MHICYICGEYPPEPHGGLGTVVQTLARHLVTAGHQVTVLGLDLKKERRVEHDRGVTIIRLPNAGIPKLNFLLNQRKIKQELHCVHKACPIDIIEAAESGMWCVPKKFPAIKCLRMHGGHTFFSTALQLPLVRRKQYLEKVGFAKTDIFCAVSHYVADQTRLLLNLGDVPITILPNTVDETRFSPRSTPIKENLLLYVGTLAEKKGIRQLVLAMTHIVDAIPSVHLRIIGRDTIDPNTTNSFKETLKQCISPNVLKHIEFIDPVSNEVIPDYLAEANICVYPSHMEALPMAWLEALTMGKAVIGGDIGPGHELITSQQNGLLVNPHDPKAIAEGVIDLLQNPDKLDAMSKHAKESTRNIYGREKIMVQNINFYESLITKKTLNCG